MSSTTKKIIVNETPLGKVIVRDYTDKYKEQHPGGMSNYLTYYKYIYFKPYNGAYIENIVSQRTSYSSLTDSTVEYPEETNFFRPLTDKNSEALQKMPELYGCYEIGVSYAYVGAPDYMGEPTDNITTTTVTINGETEYLSLELIGSIDYAKLFYFRYDYDFGDTCTFVDIESDSEQTYTNIVGFGKQTDSQVPEKFLFAANIGQNDQDIVVLDNMSMRAMPGTEYTGNNLNFTIHQYTSNDLNKLQLYVNCRICLFSLATGPCRRIDKNDAYSEYEFEVNSINPSAAAKIKNGNVEDALIYANCKMKLPNGCISFKKGESKYFLYPDIDVRDRAVEKGINIPETIVKENTGTIPDDLQWLENCTDFDGVPISRYTHVAKLINYNDEPIQASSIVDAESTYARFTGYWRTTGKYWRNTDFPKYKWQKTDETIPCEGGNIQMKPIFKPFAACSLVVVDKQAEDLTAKYPNFFIEPMKEHYLGSADSINADKTKKYYKEWSVDTNSVHNLNMKTLSNFAKTVSPFKVMVFSCKGHRIVYNENDSESGKSLIDISKTHCIGNAALQKFTDAENYWWSAGNFGENQKPSIGLFSCCSYSGGLQNIVTRASLGNCVPNDPSKLITGMDNMFYVMGSTATHYNYGNSNEMAELPFLCSLINPSYHDLCYKFNDLVDNLKGKVFERIKKFYKDYYEVMFFCLSTEDDKLMWDMTYNMIIADLNDGGRKYFSIPYRPKSKQGYDGYFHCGEEAQSYLIHDGFVGLIRREIFEDDKENSKKYFIEIPEFPIDPADIDPNDQETAYEYQTNLAQHLKYDTKLMNISNGLKELKTDIETISSLGKGYPAWLKRIALTEPVAKSTGAFLTSNQPFMANPNKDQDDWLTSDDELVILAQQEWKDM